jgi:hypothetical protein
VSNESVFSYKKGAAAVLLVGAMSSAIVGFGGQGPRWTCAGSHDCAAVSCVNYPPPNDKPGWSCANVVPVQHKKCYFTGETGSCTESDEPCMRFIYHVGGLCIGTPASCSGDTTDVEASFTETGCHE